MEMLEIKLCIKQEQQHLNVKVANMLMAAIQGSVLVEMSKTVLQLKVQRHMKLVKKPQVQILLNQDFPMIQI